MGDYKNLTQEFNGAVAQVAAGDIHNHFHRDYWGWDSEELIFEWENCKHKRRAAQRKILLAPNMLIFFIVAFCLVMAGLSGKLMASPKEEILGFLLIAGTAIFMFPKANKKYGKFIKLQQQRMEAIELVLMDRGVEL